MLSTILDFLKNPIYQEDTNFDSKYRFSIFFRLLGYALLFSFVLGLVTDGIISMLNLDIGKHAIEDFMKMHSPWFLFGLAVLAAPFFEELFFRGPFSFFKDSPYFKYVFYLLTLVFGFYHITNFEINTTTLLFSPVLVAPQLSVGVFLGYIRVRFGLLWAIALHACYNLIFIGPVIVMQLLNIPFE